MRGGSATVDGRSSGVLSEGCQASANIVCDRYLTFGSRWPRPCAVADDAARSAAAKDCTNEALAGFVCFEVMEGDFCSLLRELAKRQPTEMLRGGRTILRFGIGCACIIRCRQAVAPKCQSVGFRLRRVTFRETFLSAIGLPMIYQEGIATGSCSIHNIVRRFLF